MGTDAVVSLGGLSIGRDVEDESGCRWTLTRLDGWFGGVSPVPLWVTRPGIDGVMSGPVSMSGRLMTIEGVVWAPDSARRDEAIDTVSSVLTGSIRQRLLVVSEPGRGLARQCVVELGGPTLVELVGHQAATFSLAVFAPSPVRHGAELRSVESSRYAPGSMLSIPLTIPIVFGPPGASGFVTATNHGTSAAQPTIRFRGPLTDPAVRVVGGPHVRLLMTLQAGEEVVVDMGTRTVMSGPASRRSMLSADSSWWSLPPGDTTMQVSAAAGTGTAVIEWRDAW